MRAQLIPVLLVLLAAPAHAAPKASQPAKAPAKSAPAKPATPSPCAKDRTLACLKANAKKLYQEDFRLFFAILQQGREKGTTCKGTLAKDFFDVAPYLQGNVDVTKYFYTNVEKSFAVARPECFLRAYKSATPEAKKLIQQDLRAPRAVTKAQLQGAFAKFQNSPELKPTIQELSR